MFRVSLHRVFRAVTVCSKPDIDHSSLLIIPVRAFTCGLLSVSLHTSGSCFPSFRVSVHRVSRRHCLFSCSLFPALSNACEGTSRVFVLFRLFFGNEFCGRECFRVVFCWVCVERCFLPPRPPAFTPRSPSLSCPCEEFVLLRRMLLSYFFFFASHLIP